MSGNGKSAKQRREIGKYFVLDPEICHGQMTFKGTRVPVTTVLGLMAKGYSIEQMLKSYPEVTRPAIEAAIRLAISTLKKQYRLKPALAQRLAA
ncbi:DUF433 domain-containing protein [Anaerolineae bacterium CFX7]|nr:DUF433 domain-containing protein [Anaerolineae bacterium CFX7]